MCTRTNNRVKNEIQRRTNTQTRVFSVNNEWSEYFGEFIAPNDTWKIYFVLKSQIGQIDFDQVELRIPD